MKDVPVMAVASGLGVVTAPLIGPPNVSLPVLMGGALGVLIALLFYLKSVSRSDFTRFEITISTILIVVTGLVAATFGTTSIVYIIRSFFGDIGDAAGLIAMFLGFQGQQIFELAHSVRSYFVNKFLGGGDGKKDL